MTLDEVVAAMRKRRIKGSRSAVWRFFDRHGISFKKACGQRSKSAPTCHVKRNQHGLLVVAEHNAPPAPPGAGRTVYLGTICQVTHCTPQA